MDIFELKKKARERCILLLADKVGLLESELSNLKASLADETKSSVGDKHETSRAMLHLEQEKLNRQLALARKDYQLVNNPILEQTSEIGSGSLVKTDKGLFFIVVNLGKILIENHEVICISSGSPFGRAIIGKEIGNSVNFNGIGYKIQAIS